MKKLLNSTLLLIALAVGAQAADKPNILVIYADDLGYGDPQCFNSQSKIATPNIDRLARQGMRFTDAHAPGSTCVPSRYGLITGRYPLRAAGMNPSKGPLIEPGRVTIASLLRDLGYATGMIGKWHLGFDGGNQFDCAKPLRGGPVDHGFDYFFGQHASLDIPPYFFIENDRCVAAPTGHIDAGSTPGWSPIQGAFWRAGGIAPGFKMEEVLPTYNRKAIEYIERHDTEKKPFLLYIALTAPHTPWLPTEAFRGKSAGNLYGDWVAQVDDAVGQVLAALDRSKSPDNTLVIFTSDNGPVWYPADVQKYGHSAAGNLRGMKGDAWEGGHREPFIVRWPGKIKPGSTSTRTICFTDMLATFAGVVGAKLPSGAGEDSVSFLPELLGKKSAGRESLVLGWGKGNQSIRRGDWKLIPFLGSGGFSKPAHVKPGPGEPVGQLYNLATDPGETKNLYATHPDIIQELTALLWGVNATNMHAEDSLPLLKDGKAPAKLEELWAGYDPAKEPLEVQVVHEWQREYDGRSITVQMLIYTVGTFKGRKTRMGAYYAFPNQHTGKVPAILQMHGGGQRAQRETVEAAAANGYACIAINWGGKPMEDEKPGDPGTDWGALDATQTTHNSHYAALTPDDKTLDAVVSPRNNNWFLITLAARRALTFLERRPEVDAARLGVEGHSMGGKLTVMTAGIDPRVKAAAPSCGGAADAPAELRARPGSSCRPANPEPLYYGTIDDLNYIRRITCPILYSGPQNDFNGNYDNLNVNWKEMPSSSVHFSISPHLNHRHIPEVAFAAPHFFDVVFKGEGTFPKTPALSVALKTVDGIPVATLQPDEPDQVVKADIYYSINPHALTRFWRTAPAVRNGNVWTARCPVFSADMPLFVMADVYYPLPKEIAGPPWNQRSPPTFLVSSWELAFDPPQFKADEVKATETADRMIQANFDSWQDWYRLNAGNPDHMQCMTRKITDPKWRSPDGAKLAIDVLDPAGGEFAVTVDVNGWNAYDGVQKGSYYATKPLAQSPDWQTVEIGLTDFKPLDNQSPGTLRSWQYVTELGLVAKVRSAKDGKQEVLADSRWTDQRKLRNLRWVGGEYPTKIVMPGQRETQERR